MKQARLIFAPLVAALLGCAQQPGEPGGKVRAAVSIRPHAWLVEQVGGEHVEVITLVQPGESAELYQPSDAQVSQVARASVYFRTGMPLEASRGFQTLRSLGSLKVVDLRDGITLRDMAAHRHHEEEGHASQAKETPGKAQDPLHDHDANDAGKDPHIWLSPRLLKIQARTVAQALSAVDPQHEADYQRNLAFLEQMLDEADAAIRKTLAPYRGRAFFVFHPAWGYFADDYGLRQIAIETEGKEPGDRELTELQKLARREKARVIFVHPQSGARSSQALAQAIGGRVETINDLATNPLESLQETARRLAESFHE